MMDKRLMEKCVICDLTKHIGLFKLSNSTAGSVCIDCYDKADKKTQQEYDKKYDAYNMWANNAMMGD